MKVNDDATKSKSSSNIVHSRYYDDKNRLPQEVDFLFAYSTLEGYLSYRDVEDGTWYIQMLCKAIREEESKEISAILRYTHALIAKMVATYRDDKGKDVEVKMVATYEDRLTKLFYISKPPQVGGEEYKIFIFYSISRFKLFFVITLQRL